MVEEKEKKSMLERVAEVSKNMSNYEVLTTATSTAGAIVLFKEKGIEVTAEEIEKEGHPIEDALRELLPMFDNISELKEIKVGFEVEFKEKVKGGVGIKLAILSSDVGGETTTRKTHQVKFLLKKDKN